MKTTFYGGSVQTKLLGYFWVHYDLFVPKYDSSKMSSAFTCSLKGVEITGSIVVWMVV
jgi:hypothetical protein